jgi:hypothetical protein
MLGINASRVCACSRQSCFLATYVDGMPNPIIPARHYLRNTAMRAAKEGGDLRFNVPHGIAHPDRFAKSGGILPGIAQDHERSWGSAKKR